MDHWQGNGALGYLTLQAMCDDVIAAPPVSARVIVASERFPTGALGYWVRMLAVEAGLVAVLTATSPPRLPHLTGAAADGNDLLAIAIPASNGPPVVVDVSMGAVTQGHVLAGARLGRGARAFRRPERHTRRSRSRSASSCPSERPQAPSMEPFCSSRVLISTRCKVSASAPRAPGCPATL